MENKIAHLTEVPPFQITPEKLVWLDNQNMQLHKNNNGGFDLTITPEQTYLNVKAMNAFPRNHPNKFIQFKLSDAPKDTNSMIGMLKDLKMLAKEQQGLVEECLRQSHNHTEILKILDVQEKYNVVIWFALTNRGHCKIVIPEVYNNIYRQPDGLVLISDISGNQYSITDALKLDSESLSIINMYT